jgi:hypothetical protein
MQGSNGVKIEGGGIRERVTGAETAGAPIPARDIVRRLLKEKPPKGQNWSVFCYFLNRDIVVDGKADDLFGYVIMLGSYKTEEQAKQRVEALIQETGHAGFCAAKYGVPGPLERTPRQHVTLIHVDEKNRLVKMADKESDEEQAQHKEKERIQHEILEEKDRELNPNDIEHFRHNAMCLLENRSAIQLYKAKLQEAEDAYKLRVEAVCTHRARHPEHEDEWVDHEEKKFAERYGTQMAAGIRAGWASLREELFPDIAAVKAQTKNQTEASE